MGKTRIKRRLEIGGIALQVAKLPGFPTLFDGVIGGVEGIAVSMQMGVRYTVYRARGKMHKLGPDHIARFAVVVTALDTNARFHLTFNFLHGVVDAGSELIENAFITRQLIHHRYGLRSREGEVKTHAPVSFIARRKLLAGVRVEVVAQREVAFSVHLS